MQLQRTPRSTWHFAVRIPPLGRGWILAMVRVAAPSRGANPSTCCSGTLGGSPSQRLHCQTQIREGTGTPP